MGNSTSVFTVSFFEGRSVQLWQEQSFDIILMDIQMPVLDGVEATMRISANEQASGGHIPIVALTAHAMQGDREQSLALDMDAYVSKPIKSQELLATIKRLVADREN
ncbi:MAG: response regulator [Deltaproteobacteria bacterium]|nr:response regulator [Deltaproteobacteria bacterium]